MKTAVRNTPEIDAKMFTKRTKAGQPNSIQVECMSPEELRADMIRRGEMTPNGHLVPQVNNLHENRA